MRIPRDYHLGHRAERRLLFYSRPFRELAKWILLFLRLMMGRYVRPFHRFLNSRDLAKRESHARRLSQGGNEFYPGKHDYYEIQIGNDTRPVAVLREGEPFTFEHRAAEREELLLGVAPLVEGSDCHLLHEWECLVTVRGAGGGEARRFRMALPYNGRGDTIAYYPGDGWVDVRVELGDFAGSDCEISVIFASKGTTSGRESVLFGVAGPQVVVRRGRAEAKKVVLISVESLTDLGYLEARYGFGNLANLERLSRDAVCYPRVYTPSAATLSFAASMLTGLLPSQHGIGDYGLAADSFECEVSSRRFPVLAELFKRAGFFTAFGGVQARFSAKSGWARGFDRYYQVFEKWSVSVPEIDWLIRTCRSLEGVDTFVYQHLDLLHEPLLSFGDRHSGRIYDAELLASAEGEQTRELYGAQLERVDRQIGDLLDYLQSTGQYESTALIVTGDHGCGINWVKHGGDSLYEERLRVPLMVKYPSWCEEPVPPRAITNSSTEIHRVFHALLNEPLPAEVLELPQFNPEYDGYGISETIMNPNRERKRHSIALMGDGYKYVARNEIDWEGFEVSRYGDDELYEWSEEGGTYLEDEDVSPRQQAIMDEFRARSRKILDENLAFLSRYAPEKY